MQKLTPFYLKISEGVEQRNVSSKLLKAVSVMFNVFNVLLSLTYTNVQRFGITTNVSIGLHYSKPHEIVNWEASRLL